MGKFGFDSKFIAWIKLLYNAPSASVHTNGVQSSPFPLQRGHVKDTHFPPLLLNLAIEPLATWLRFHDGFEGISHHGLVHKLSLYADDLLLYISNPVTSLPPILSILDQFGHLSGYKLILQKSKVFFVNQLVRNCKLDLARWASLPLSPVVGRVNLIKMVILPKFLYLFQHIPICINKSFFTSLDRQFNLFIWNGKPARLKRSILQLPKSEGGLSLPNLRYYYWACNINRLLYWAGCKSPDSCPPWVHTETSSSSGSLRSIICSQLPIVTHTISDNPVVTSTIKKWLQFRKQLVLHRASTLAALLNNHLFSPSCSDPSFRHCPRAK